MTKLTDTQCVLLSTAAKRDSLSIYPLPTSLKPGGGLHKALAALSTRSLIEERETSEATAVSRTDDDYRYGLFVTPAGLTAIGVECEGGPSTDKSPVTDVPKVERIERGKRGEITCYFLRAA